MWFHVSLGQKGSVTLETNQLYPRWYAMVRDKETMGVSEGPSLGKFTPPPQTTPNLVCDSAMTLEVSASCRSIELGKNSLHFLGSIESMGTYMNLVMDLMLPDS